MRESWRLVAMTSAARIYWLLAMLGTAVITARYLGPTGRGVMVAATTWATLFATFGNLSLSQVVVFLAAAREPKEWLPGTVGGLGAILGVVTLIGATVAAVLHFASGGEMFQNIPPATLFIALLAFPLMIWIEDNNGVLISLGRLRVLSLSQVAGGTALLALTLLAVGAARLGINGAVAAFVLCQAMVAVVTTYAVLRHAGRPRVEKEVVVQLLTGGAKLHLNAIGTFLFTQANVLILNHYRPPHETAWFQLAVQLVTAVQIIPMAVSTVTYSLVSKYGPDQAWPQQRRLLAETLALIAVLMVVGYAVADRLIPMIFGIEFTPTVPIFRILLLSTIGMTMSMVMASQWIARGLFLQAALITLITGGITVIANWMVVPRYGMEGAAWVTVGTYCLSILGNGAMALWVQSRWRSSLAE